MKRPRERPRTDGEIRELAADAAEGKLFGSWQFNSPAEAKSMIPVVFMVMSFMEKKDLKDLKDREVVHFYEYVHKAGPRSVNGYPCFMSMHVLTAGEWERFIPAYEEYRKMQARFRNEPIEKPRQYIFVGEKRSKRAKQLGLYWEDGGLAASQLFMALRALGIDPRKHTYVNWFEPGGPEKVRAHDGPVVAMGRKVEEALNAEGIENTYVAHPISPGEAHRVEKYVDYIRKSMTEAGLLEKSDEEHDLEVSDRDSGPGGAYYDRDASGG